MGLQRHVSASECWFPAPTAAPSFSNGFKAIKPFGATRRLEHMFHGCRFRCHVRVAVGELGQISPNNALTSGGHSPHTYIKVAKLTPCRRHTSAVAAPASYSRRIPKICSAANRERFVCPPLWLGELYLRLEEFQAATSGDLIPANWIARVMHLPRFWM